MYAIAELAPDAAGGFAPRGAVKELWKSRDFEVMVSGPAETGKTWGCLQYLDALMWKYPRAQGVLCRKKYAYLIGSACRTLSRVLGPNSPVVAYGGEKPQWYDYPNGSRIWVAGMDNPGKALSSERDVIYVNQAEELSLEDWETLGTRCTGRGAVMPYTRLFGDCNPASPSHWILGRAKAGSLRMLESRHADNPSLYDDVGQLTEQGKRTMGILSALSGNRRQRLFEGKWSKAEGLVYDSFSRAAHVVTTESLPRPRRYVAGVDWGYTNPGSIQLCGIDGDGRMYRVREVHRTRRLIDWWVERAKELHGEYGIEAFACDPAEPAYIEAFQNAGLPAVSGWNDIAPGVQAVQKRLEAAGDGRVRIQFVEPDADDADEELVSRKLPTGLLEEFDAYSWPKTAEGKAIKEVPEDKDNHACDALRYAVAYVDGLGETPVDFDTCNYVLTASNR